MSVKLITVKLITDAFLSIHAISPETVSLIVLPVDSLPGPLHLVQELIFYLEVQGKLGGNCASLEMPKVTSKYFLPDPETLLVEMYFLKGNGSRPRLTAGEIIHGNQRPEALYHFDLSFQSPPPLWRPSASLFQGGEVRAALQQRKMCSS